MRPVFVALVLTFACGVPATAADTNNPTPPAVTAPDTAKPKPMLKVLGDGYPSGHGSPEGVACDYARAFIKSDVAMFKDACLSPSIYGKGPNAREYQSFVSSVAQGIRKEARQTRRSPRSVKSIGLVFAARHLTKLGPASPGDAALNIKDVEFVDVGVYQQNGEPQINRTLVLQAPNGKWYVHALPSLSPLFSAGLSDEKPSDDTIGDIYTLQKPS